MELSKFNSLYPPVIRHIPVGSAFTSYARQFMKRAAQANCDTFLYIDTDSIHCSCTPDEVKGAPEDSHHV